MSSAAVAALRFNVPLPISTALGLPGLPRALPFVYGREVWCPGIPTRDKFTWILAGHSLQQLLGVSGTDVNGQKLAEATLINTRAPDGRQVAVARLSRVAEGTPLFLVQGRPGNAAAIIQDQLSNAGLSITGRVQGIAGDELAGRVDDPTKSVAAVIGEIALNSGALWSRGRPGMLVPATVSSAAIRSYTRRDLFNLQIECTMNGVANQVRATYSSGKPGTAVQRPSFGFAGFGAAAATGGGGGGLAPLSIGNRVAVLEAPSGELEASVTGRMPGSIGRYGLIETTLELRWVRTPAQAARVVQAWLRHNGQPAWSVTADVDLDLDIYPGDRVDIDDLHVPDCGPWLVMSAEPDIGNHRTKLVLRAPAGPAFSTVIEFPTPAESPNAGAGVFGLFGGSDHDNDDVNDTVTEPPQDGTEQGDEGSNGGLVEVLQDVKPESFIVALSDETTPVVEDQNNAARRIHAPYSFQLQEVQIGMTSNATNLDLTQISIVYDKPDGGASIGLLNCPTGGVLFRSIPLVKNILKGKPLDFYIVAVGDGDITGLKINLVGRRFPEGYSFS